VTCAECAKLLAQFFRKSSAYYKTVRALALRIETADAAEYVALKRAMNDAQIDCELARVELAQHKRRHAMGETRKRTVGGSHRVG
jgi:hypothetical protein